MKKIKNGFFVTVEGIDGSGKSSIVNFLSEALRSKDFNVIKTREPGGTKLGAALRELITGAVGPLGLENLGGQNQQRDCQGAYGESSNDVSVIADKAEFLLFAADRAQHLSALIKPELEQGAIVISDRGSDSSLAYQGYGKGLDLEMISKINSWILGDIKPDLVIYLKLDYQTAMERVIGRGEKITGFEKKGRAFFGRVIHGFNEIFTLRSHEFPDSVMEIDASRSAEDVKKEVLDKVLRIILPKELI